MTDPLQIVLQQAGLRTTPFAPTSRYYTTDVATHTPDGSETPVVYLRRRFVPAADRFALLYEHTVAGGERPDTIAYQHLGDPERFWQLCDANTVIRPDELTETVGRRIRITLPEGIPGLPHA